VIRSQLECTLLDHFPEDPYSADDIYNAALYVLAWQHATPLVQPPRSVPPLAAPFTTSPSPIPPSLPTIYTFLHAPEVPTCTQSDQVPVAHITTWQSSVPLVEASCPFSLPALATSAPHSCAQLPPPLPQAFPRSLPVLFTSPSNLVLVMHTQTLQPFAPLAHTPRDVFLTASSSPSSYLPAEPLPPPVHSFPAVLQSAFAVTCRWHVWLDMS
jgi:hypothetical protein